MAAALLPCKPPPSLQIRPRIVRHAAAVAVAVAVAVAAAAAVAATVAVAAAAAAAAAAAVVVPLLPRGMRLPLPLRTLLGLLISLGCRRFPLREGFGAVSCLPAAYDPTHFKLRSFLSESSPQIYMGRRNAMLWRIMQTPWQMHMRNATRCGECPHLQLLPLQN